MVGKGCLWGVFKAIVQSLVFTVSEMGSHWRALSRWCYNLIYILKESFSFLCATRVGVEGVKWEQGDQLGTYCNF